MIFFSESFWKISGQYFRKKAYPVEKLMKKLKKKFCEWKSENLTITTSQFNDDGIETKQKQKNSSEEECFE